MEGEMTRHELFNPEGMPPATGFSYGAKPATGRTLYIAGITGHDSDLGISGGWVEQFSAACHGVAAVITEAGGEPSDLGHLTIYTTDVDGYRSGTKEVGAAYREVFGKHFPPMALIGVSELVDPKASVELVGLAVVPD